MAIKNLLIAYNGGPASDAALTYAIAVSKKYDAHLTGVLAHGVSKVSRNIPSWFSSDMQASIRGVLAQKAVEIEAKFRKAAKGEVPEGKTHWIEVGGNPDQTVSDYAMLHDLTIVGQYENLVEADELELHPDRITHTSGRPVVLVPKSYTDVRLDTDAVLAWDGNRTATQALSAAMLVLETKKKVTVVTVESPHLGTPLQGIDVTTVLARHGVEAEHLQMANPKGSVADAVLGVCRDAGAGLLVMGAYERSRLGQEFIGGVTKEVIRKTHIPVLMCH